jgi:DNA polymerase elongation subunit (family B)
MLKNGLIPRVLEPIIRRRRWYKSQVETLGKGSRAGTMYEQRSKALKWILVTCFGYTGYRNARFGRIECHEAITAYARELLIRAKTVAEEHRYEVIHGIIDSLWLKPNGRVDHERLIKAISRESGVPVELEGVYKWIVFLPSKMTGMGVSNRYYGRFENGELKVRGLELRRQDTAGVVLKLQSDMLKVLARATTASEFIRAIPGSIKVLRRYAKRVLEGSVAVDDLIITTRLSRFWDEYEQFNNQVASAMQYRDEGIEVHPGECIQYVILDSTSKDYRARVKIAPLLGGSERYDRRIPFGYSVDAIDKIARS